MLMICTGVYLHMGVHVALGWHVHGLGASVVLTAGASSRPSHPNVRKSQPPPFPVRHSLRPSLYTPLRLSPRLSAQVPSLDPSLSYLGL